MVLTFVLRDAYIFKKSTFQPWMTCFVLYEKLILCAFEMIEARHVLDEIGLFLPDISDIFLQAEVIRTQNRPTVRFC